MDILEVVLVAEVVGGVVVVAPEPTDFSTLLVNLRKKRNLPEWKFECLELTRTAVVADAASEEATQEPATELE